MQKDMMLTNTKDNNRDKRVDQRRMNNMSLMNLNLNISYFNIDIHVKKNEDRKNEKIRKTIEHEERLRNVLKERNNLNDLFTMYRQ